MIHIAFIGNCQLASLCYYLQELLKNDNKSNYTIKYLIYGEDMGFNYERDHWIKKVENKVENYDDSKEYIKICDYVFFQEICKKKSEFSNKNSLLDLKKPTCKLTMFPSIYIEYNNFDESILELINKENKNRVDIKVSKIFQKYKMYNLMLTVNHAKTFLFLQLVKEICYIMDINWFNQEDYDKFMKNDNHMELP